MIDSMHPGASESGVTVPVAESGTQSCWVSFGGNVGDVKATFDAALALLSLHPQIQLQERSGLYCAVPMGSRAGAAFLNSVCRLTTTLSPQELLNVLQSVENQLGRQRDIRWGPRTLDLDLLTHGDAVLDTATLVLPHVGLTYRRFVLDPLAEVDPNWMHPTCLVTAAQLSCGLKRRPLRVSLLDVPSERLSPMAEVLEEKFPYLQFVCDGANYVDRLRIQTTGAARYGCGTVVDLRRSPGDLLEQLTAALTAMFDVPERIGDW